MAKKPQFCAFLASAFALVFSDSGHGWIVSHFWWKKWTRKFSQIRTLICLLFWLVNERLRSLSWLAFVHSWASVTSFLWEVLVELASEELPSAGWLTIADWFSALMQLWLAGVGSREQLQDSFEKYFRCNSTYWYLWRISQEWVPTRDLWSNISRWVLLLMNGSVP